MLLEILPELLDQILTLLSGEDIKNMSLCSKRCNHLVKPTLWGNVTVTEKLLFASTSVPNHITFARDLRAAVITDKRRKPRKLMSVDQKRELTEKLVALLELSSPTTLRLWRCSEVSMVTRCLATISQMTGLQNLEIRCDVSEDGLEHLSHLTELVNLDVSYNRNITDDGFKHIGHMTDLKNLDVSGCNISDAGLQHIGHLTGLVNLNISACRNISDAGLQHLGHLTGLVNLNISACHYIFDAGLKHLGRLTGLKALDVSFCSKISDDGLQHIGHLTGLVNLNISRCDISDDGLKHLRHSTELVNLDVSGCNISDDGLKHLGRFTNSW